MKEAVIFACNQVLQNIRIYGWSGEALQNCGRILLRLYELSQAWDSKIQEDTFATNLKDVISELQKVLTTTAINSTL